MRSKRGWACLAAGAALAAGIQAFASCTTFNGLSAEEHKDAGVPEGGQAVPGYLSTTDAARVCSLLFSCPHLDRESISTIAVPADAANFSICMDWLSGPVDPGRIGLATQRAVLSCMAKATTCDAAGACTAFDEIAADDPRCASVDAGYLETCTAEGDLVICDKIRGNQIIHCKNSYFNREGSCTLGSDGWNYCAAGKTCPGATCDGLFVLDLCMANVHMRYDCSVTGQTCGLDSVSQTVGCVVNDTLEKCTLAGTKCEGDKVWVCDGAQASYFDCASLGSKCVAQGGYAICVGLLDECSPADNAGVVCGGDKISLCVGGRKTWFDCASIGKKCQPPAPPRTAWCG
ncbi:MAG: hypothetical protein HY898_21045 [Deltaproteobacteria bacterium]|nr:hypothetical protein [Deltaproteobacteria bacterium]